MNAIIYMMSGKVIYARVPYTCPFRSFFDLFGDWHLAQIKVNGQWGNLINKLG